MSVAITSTHNTMGVRRLGGMPPANMRPRRARSGYITLGAAPDTDTISELVASGYDPGLIQTWVALGVTNEQLLALPFPATPDEIAAASQQMMTALTAPSSVPTSTVQPAADIGTLQSQANDLVAKVTAMQNDLAPLIQQATTAMQAGHNWPTNATAALNAQQNDLVSIESKVNLIYRAAFGTGAPGLSGLGVDPVTIAAAAATVAVVLAAIALWWQHENTLKQQIAVQQTQANTQAQVAQAATGQANQLLAMADQVQSSNPGLAAQYRQQAQALVQQAATTAAGGSTTAQIGQFFQQYWPYFALGAGALVLLPMLTGRRR